MGSRAVRRAFENRVKVLGRELPGALDDDVEALHRSRVASRRLREILPVIALGSELAVGRPSIRSLVRQITRALGGVRELDVALGLLDELAGRYPDLAGVTGAVRLQIAEEHRARRETMVSRLDEAGAVRLPEELLELASKIQAGPQPDLVATLSKRLGRRADRLEAAIDEAGALYVAERLHEVRIAAKRLRYTLELVHEFGGAGTRRLTGPVKQFQDLLGRLHDLEVVRGRVHRYTWEGTGGHREQADRLEQLIEHEIRELHAAYLAGAARLLDVVAACRARIQPRLAAVRRQGRRPGGGR